MSAPQAFTISSESLARFPAAIQKSIVNVVQSELEKARSNCIQALATPPTSQTTALQKPHAPMDEAWQREATRFVHSIEGFLSSCPVKRGPNFKADSKQILEDAFQRSQFLNKAECRIVAKAAGLSSQQVRTWFQNKRNRSSKKSSIGCKSRSTRLSKKSASGSSSSTTISRATSISSASSNIGSCPTTTLDALMGAGSSVMLAVPHRIQEVGLAMEDSPAPILPFEGCSIAFGPATSEVLGGQAPLWLDGVIGTARSTANSPSSTESDWAKISQSLWLPYIDPTVAPLWGPSHLQADSWLSADTAAFAMAASGFMDPQVPVTDPARRSPDAASAHSTQQQ